MSYRSYLPSPLGVIAVVADDDAVTGIRIGIEPTTEPEGAPNAVSKTAARELGEYFAGERRQFTVPVAPAVTTFQRQVLQQVAQIPFGTTASYGAIAQALVKPGAARAVGMANRNNPIPVIIPCHRVIGADGSLTGYTGGLALKAWLLEHERACASAECAA